jgi:hypothetical protein
MLVGHPGARGLVLFRSIRNIGLDLTLSLFPQFFF